MIDMVSSVHVHGEYGGPPPRRNEGARCSKRVLDGMCTKMATTSSSSSNIVSVFVGGGPSSSTSTATLVAVNDDDSDGDVPKTFGVVAPRMFGVTLNGSDQNSVVRAKQKVQPDKSSSTPLGEHPMIKCFGPLFAPDDFDIQEQLGEGFFNKIFKVRNKLSGELLVMKKVKSVGCRRTVHMDAAREAEIMRRLQHRNVIALRGICISVDELGQWDANLLVSYCDGGSLSRLILDKSQPFPWCQKAEYALDIATAMAYIHSQEIIHRDLTSMNVLIRRGPRDGDGGRNWGTAVVADLGLSCYVPVNGEKLAQVGTTYFMSPECLKEEYYDQQSDVFSFGIILCQLIARIDADPESGMHRTSIFGLDYMLFTPMCPLDTPLELLRLAFQCCVMNPKDRVGFEMAAAELVSITQQLLSVPSSPDPREGRESRLGRSRSDVALKRTKGSAMRKLSSTYTAIHVKTLVEGETDETTSTVLLMEELARDAARDDPDFDHRNPFLDHERFRKERKIVPSKKSSTPRRRTEIKPQFSRVAVVNTGKLRRRSKSLPVKVGGERDVDGRCVDSTDGRRRLTRRDTSIVFNARRRGVDYDDSVDGVEGDSDGDGDDVDLADGDDEGGSPTGGIPMEFRDKDREFVGKMELFASRRHILIPNGGLPKSCSRRHKSDDTTYSMAGGNCGSNVGSGNIDGNVNNNNNNNNNNNKLGDKKMAGKPDEGDENEPSERVVASTSQTQKAPADCSIL